MYYTNINDYEQLLVKNQGQSYRNEILLTVVISLLTVLFI
jgi:hypothetical protein